MKTILSIALVISIFFSPLNCQSQDANLSKEGGLISRLDGLGEDVEALLDSFHTAGLAISIVKGDEIIYSEGFGYRDVINKIPVDENTIFGIGSCSKAFTGSVLGILAGEGKLALTDRPKKYIPDLRFYNSTMDDAIQIKNLLSHSTGISSHSSECSAIFFTTDNINDLVPRVKYLEPAANVGEAFIYNNYMYTLSAIISERITGKSWSTNVNDLIFSKLGMNHSYTSATEAKKAGSFSYGYSVDNNNKITKVLAQELPPIGPGGEIHCSVSDMAKWLSLWLNEGKYDGKQILPLEYFNAAIRPQQIMGGGPTERFSDDAQFMNYGYGWMSRDFKGYYRVEHSGAVSGYTSNVVFFPTEKIGIVVLSNQSNSNISNSVTNLFVDQLLEIENAEPRVPTIQYTTVDEVDSNPPKTTLKEMQKPSFSLEDLPGEYEHPGYGKWVISYTDGILYANSPFTTLRLSHDNHNNFNSHFTEELPTILTGGSWIRFNFVTGADESVTGVQVNMSADGVVFKRPVNH